MEIRKSQPADTPIIASILKEADDWLSKRELSLWTANEIGLQRIARDTDAGTYYAAYEDLQMVGVMRLEKEDPYFWPEISPDTSIYLHKLAVRRSWAGTGISTALLSYAKNCARKMQREYVRLDCFAKRDRLRDFYEKNEFVLRDVVRKGTIDYARYEALTDSISVPEN